VARRLDLRVLTSLANSRSTRVARRLDLRAPTFLANNRSTRVAEKLVLKVPMSLVKEPMLPSQSGRRMTVMKVLR